METENSKSLDQNIDSAAEAISAAGGIRWGNDDGSLFAKMVIAVQNEREWIKTGIDRLLLDLADGVPDDFYESGLRAALRVIDDATKESCP